MLFGLILFDIVIFEGFAISLDRSIGKRSEQAGDVGF